MNRTLRTALSSAIALASAGTSALAQNAPTVQYTTQAGDTCTSIAERVYGSATRIDVIHLYNPLGAMPHRFPAGRVLTLPRTPPPPRPSSDAEVGFVRNDVHAYTPGDHPARVQEPLTRGHRVGTNGNSSADVTMADERSVHLEENTLVVVLGRYSLQTQQRETAQDTQLERGTLRTQLAALSGAPPPQPIVVTTPAAQVTASAGESEVTVDAARATRVGVLSGQSEVTAQGQHVVVPEGSGTTAELGHPPAPPHPLPPRPEWDQSPPRIAFLASGVSTAFGSYRVAARAASVVQWRVQLARDAQFRALIVDRRVDAPVVRFEARELPEGSYFLRVRSVDAQHFESQPSAVQRFSVVVPEFIVSVPGRRAAVRVLDGLFCALDGDALQTVSSPLEVSPGRAHALRCADNAQGEGAADFPIAASHSGLILAQTRVGPAEWSTTGGSRRVAIRVTDAVGAPLPGFDVTAGVDPGASATVQTSQEPGTHFANVQWEGAGAAYTLRLTVAASEITTVAIPASARPITPVITVAPHVSSTPPAPVAIAPEPEPDYRWSAGFGVGAVVSLGPLGVGVAGSIQARYRIALPVLDVLVGLGMGFERFACEGGTGVPGGYCTGPATRPQDPRITVESASFGVPLGISHRFGRIVRPYLTVQPQLVVGRSRVTSTATEDGASRVGFGLLATLGLQLDLGMHAPFIEAGYRYAALADDRLGTLDVGGPAFALGYRVQW